VGSGANGNKPDGQPAMTFLTGQEKELLAAPNPGTTANTQKGASSRAHQPSRAGLRAGRRIAAGSMPAPACQLPFSGMEPRETATCPSLPRFVLTHPVKRGNHKVLHAAQTIKSINTLATAQLAALATAGWQQGSTMPPALPATKPITLLSTFSHAPRRVRLFSP